MYYLFLQQYKLTLRSFKPSQILEDLNHLKATARSKRKENKKFFAKLKQHPPKDLDEMMQELHTEEFAHTDCLDCANCCKTTGPLFTDRDITRISKLFQLKPKAFIDRYLRLDEENDYVLQSVPCAFLGDDNKCLIYDVRPKACAEFPHTDRRKFQQISHLTIKNVEICPAAFHIVEKMKQLLH